MELIFLSRGNLKVKDYAFISDDFNLVLDSVVPQKSYFKVNKVGINAEVGDIVFLKNNVINYLGIVETLQLEGDFQSKVETTDFSSLLDVKVLVNSYSGDLCLFLQNLINSHFKNSGDALQNLSYLSIIKEATVIGNLTYENDTLLSIKELSETLSKSYGIRYDTLLKIEGGVISGIEVMIRSVTRGLVVKSNLAVLSGLSITDSTIQTLNKITFIPKVENTAHRSTLNYYLLSDGTISNLPNHSLRYPYVKGTAAIYSDNEYSSLLTKAQTELLKGNLEHNISFKVFMNNTFVVPFKNLKLGDFVFFIAGSKTYNTMVTQLSFKGNFYECNVVLGEYRIRLTEKIKLLENKK